MEKCAICHKRVAVVYMTKMEPDGKSETQGICLKCARDMGIKPVDEIMGKFGISPDDIDFDSLDADIEELADSIGDDQTDEKSVEEKKDGELEPAEGRAPSLDIAKIFGSGIFPMGKMPSNGTKSDKKAGKSTEPKFKFLEQYCTNLNEKAKRGGIDRIVGRDRELDRVMQILCRRQKNNPCLIGEPGVGKTAVAEALSQKIADGNVPVKLLDKEVYLVDLTALVAGTQFRGQFESRMQGLLNDVKKKGNVILVIDEVHNIVGAGEAEGSMNAANILKPALSRGEIQVIGATTMTEYRKHIEKDSALERRFQPVVINEPSIDDTIKIMLGIKHYYENYHGIKISDEIAEKSVHLSERYITDRFLPDKAIDVIDEAGSRVNLKNKAIYEASVLRERKKTIDEDIAKATEDENFEKTANLRVEKLQLDEKLNKAEAEAAKAKITSDDVAAVIEGWTKIPVHRLTETEADKLIDLERRIHERVIGQNEAVEAVSRAIRRGRADITSKKRPVSFIFAGPTGVGKTELVKTIAEVMFDSEEALIRIDMSEYMEKHSVSKLIGSPPGYVGYDDAGQLTEKVRRKPYSVILLDEIEKAHPDVFNLFLQILDDGRVADSHGKIVNFENTIIIMTTNAGSEFKSSKSGFMADNAVTLADNVDKSLKELFRPEFLNRIDDIVTFKPLTKAELKQIIDLMLKDIVEKIAEKGAQLVVTDPAKELILETGYDTKYGARPLKRAIQKLIEDKLSMLSIRGKITPGTVITAGKKGEEIELTAISS